MTLIRKHQKRVVVMTEDLTQCSHSAVVTKPSKDYLQPGPQRVGVLQNLSSKNVTVRAKAITASISVANLVPH